MQSWQRTLALMFTSQLLSSVGFSIIFPFLPSYVNSLGSSLGINLVFLAGAVFSAQAITMTIASPIWGTLADRFDKKSMVERAMFGDSLILLAMAFSTNAEMLVVLSALLNLYITPGEEGAAYGLDNSVISLSRAVAPMLGVTVVYFSGYGGLFFIATALFAATAAFAFWKLPEVKNSNEWKAKKPLADGIINESLSLAE